MITETAYSKDPNIIPEGIAVTMGKDMIEEKGGLLKFLRWFEEGMQDDNGLWFHKCKNRPAQDINYVYVIVANRLYCRCYYGGHKKIAKGYLTPDAMETTDFNFPHVVMSGPMAKPGFKRELKGFQGFRYTTKLF